MMIPIVSTPRWVVRCLEPLRILDALESVKKRAWLLVGGLVVAVAFLVTRAAFGGCSAIPANYEALRVRYAYASGQSLNFDKGKRADGVLTIAGIYDVPEEAGAKRISACLRVKSRSICNQYYYTPIVPGFSAPFEIEMLNLPAFLNKLVWRQPESVKIADVLRESYGARGDPVFVGARSDKTFYPQGPYDGVSARVKFRFILPPNRPASG